MNPIKKIKLKELDLLPMQVRQSASFNGKV